MGIDNKTMEAEISRLGLTKPRVTLGQVTDMLRHRISYRYEQPEGTTTTFCHAYLDDKFFLATGMTSCVSPENFDVEVGLKYSRQDARDKAAKKLYELEGYCLYKQLNPELYEEGNVYSKPSE